MKLLFSTSIVGIIVVLLAVQSGLSSCTKDHIIYDTVIITDTTVTTEILTAHSWKIQYYRGVYGGDTIVYLRGGVNNTQNLDADYITFNSDGTGFNNDAVNGSHQITDWKFTNAEHTQITFKYYVTASSIYHFVTWDNLRFKNNSLMFDEYYHDNYVNVNVHDQTVRIPK
ncbi:MAG: hypothetical protein JSS70_02135 [Bacteroidetes bacterium]|nr:hypothetical protein [Bacteroidota bacterium]